MVRLPFRLNGPDVIAETVGGEALIINLASGAYFSAYGSGEAIWRAVMAGWDQPAIVDELKRVYAGEPVEMGAAVETFLAELVGEGLIVPGTAAAATREVSMEATGERAPFSPPVLTKYTDLQELLLLDPIHDVEEKAGWPLAKPQEP